jgi:hypothetical protein
MLHVIELTEQFSSIVGLVIAIFAEHNPASESTEVLEGQVNIGAILSSSVTSNEHVVLFKLSSVTVIIIGSTVP